MRSGAGGGGDQRNSWDLASTDGARPIAAGTSNRLRRSELGGHGFRPTGQGGPLGRSILARSLLHSRSGQGQVRGHGAGVGLFGGGEDGQVASVRSSHLGGFDGRGFADLTPTEGLRLSHLGCSSDRRVVRGRCPQRHGSTSGRRTAIGRRPGGEGMGHRRRGQRSLRRRGLRGPGGGWRRRNRRLAESRPGDGRLAGRFLYSCLGRRPRGTGLDQRSISRRCRRGRFDSDRRGDLGTSG